jgi:outer membrane protein TolC
LIEVLDAQRSYDEILASFYSAIYDKSQALVALESAAGVWDIE